MSTVQSDPLSPTRSAAPARLAIYAVAWRRQIKRGLNLWTQWLGSNDTALIVHIAALLMIGMSLA